MIGQIYEGCGNGNGRIVVHELQSDAQGAVTRAALEFQIDCADFPGGSSLAQLRINSTLPLP
jgi:hypothetical protein